MTNLQADVAQAALAIGSVTGSAPDSVQEATAAQDRVKALAQKIDGDTEGAEPAPADCSDCASAGDSLAQDIDQAQALMGQSEADLTSLIAAQTVHESELNGLKNVPQPANQMRISDAELLAELNGKRQAHDHAASGYINLRAQMNGAAARSALEQLISAEHAVVAALDNEIQVLPRHDSMLFQDASNKMSRTESQAHSAFDDLVAKVRADLLGRQIAMVGLKANLDSLLSGLPS